MTKGVGSTINSIIIIILILGSTVLYSWLVWHAGQEEVDMNIRETEMLRTINTVYITNRSLSTTWYISTLQSIFRTGDQFLKDYCVIKDVDIGYGYYETVTYPDTYLIEQNMNNLMKDYLDIPGTENKEPIELNKVKVSFSGIRSDFSLLESGITSTVRQNIKADYVDTHISTATRDDHTINTR